MPSMSRGYEYICYFSASYSSSTRAHSKPGHNPFLVHGGESGLPHSLLQPRRPTPARTPCPSPAVVDSTIYV